MISDENDLDIDIEDIKQKEKNYVEFIEPDLSQINKIEYSVKPKNKYVSAGSSPMGSSKGFAKSFASKKNESPKNSLTKRLSKRLTGISL